MAKYGNLLELETKHITYEAISGHPDIFITQQDDILIIAPNLPAHYKNKLSALKINFVEGSMPIGYSYPLTSHYNAVITSEYLIHKLNITDPVVRKHNASKTKINVNQGYTRCNLIFITPQHAITSDTGIKNSLTKAGIKVFYFNPDKIVLPGFKHGFIGGACGIAEKSLFLAGSLSYHSDRDKIKEFIKMADVEIVELYDGPLFDGGSIIFYNNN